MLKRFASGDDSIDLLKEREAILTLLPQISPGFLRKDIKRYTVDPSTRYYNVKLLPIPQVSHLFDTDKLSAPVASCRMETCLPFEEDFQPRTVSPDNVACLV